MAIRVSRRGAVALVALAPLLPRGARARSLAEFEREFERQEQFFQPMDQPAPLFELSDPDGHQVGLAELRGKLVVLNFIYTQCPDVCPLQTERMGEIQRMIRSTSLRDRVRLISVTADPAHDTPDVMKAYGEQHGMDRANWLFLTSGQSQPNATRALSQQYHNRYRLEPDGSITHGTVFHVIDGKGQWRGNFHGLDWKAEHLVAFLTELASHEDHVGAIAAPSLWQRVEHLL